MRRWHTIRVAKLVAMALAISIFTLACGGGKETVPLKLIPEGSNLIAEVNLTGILASDALATVFASLPADEGDPQSLEKLLDEGIGVTGVDFRQVSQLVLFADVSRENEFGGLIAKGTFDEAAVVEAVVRALGNPIRTSENNGRRIYNFGDAPDDPSLAFLEGNNLVLGTDEAVQAVIDVQDGERQRVSGSVRDAFNDLGLRLLGLVVEVPKEELPDQLPDLGDIPFLGGASEGLPDAFAAFQDLELVGLSVAQNGQIVILRVNLDFASEDSASSVGNVLEGIFKVASGLIPDAETREVLESLEVATNGSRLTIRLEVAASDLGQLVSGIFSGSREETAGLEVVPQSRLLLGLGEEMEIMPTRDHVPEGQEPFYITLPPTSGDHWETWADCGFYEDGLPDALITHNLEHGNIVVSYNLAVQKDIVYLRTIFDSFDLAAEWGVFRFYDKIPEGTVALAAWGRLETMQSVDRERIANFFDAFSGQLGPELIAC